KVLPPAFSSITNRATIVVPEDPITSNNVFTLNTPVILSADVEVVKQSQIPGPRNVGDQISYDIDVTNHGPGAANTIVMTDVIPLGMAYVSSSPPCPPPVGNVLSCPTTSLAFGSTMTRTVTLLATGAGVITNTATVSATEPDILPSNNTSSVTTTVLIPGAAV